QPDPSLWCSLRACCSSGEGETMRPSRLAVAFCFTLCLAFLLAASGQAQRPAAPSIPTNVDISQRHTNESEEAIAVNPTNPNNIVEVSNVDFPAAGMLEGVSFDGGKTWTTKLIGDNDNLGDACCDPSLSFDQYGNLFLAYLFNVEETLPIALSTDGGLTFNVIANISGIAKRNESGSEKAKGLFRFVDQPTITAGEGEVWVVVNVGGPMGAFGAKVDGLGQVGPFSTNEVVPGTNNCTYGDVAIGPGGKVMQVCSVPETGGGGGKLFVTRPPEGPARAGFGSRVFVDDTHVGGFNFIPPQAGRSVDAEPGLAWDRTGGAHNGRVYIVYSLEQKNGSNNTDILVRHSDDNGATWSAPVRVN